MTAAPTRRQTEEVAGALVPVTLAGQVYILRELPFATNRLFLARLQGEVRTRLEAVVALETVDQVMDAIAEHADLWLELIYAYDRMGSDAWAEVEGHDPKPALPDRAWLEERATATECYRAIGKVTVAAFPSMPDMLRLVPEIVPALMQAVSSGVAAATIAMASSPSTSFSPRSMAGSLIRSSIASPEPKSAPSSTPPRSAATAKRKPKSTRSRSASTPAT